MIFALILFVGECRGISFAVWNIKEKNYCGAAAISVLLILAAVFGVMNIFS